MNLIKNFFSRLSNKILKKHFDRKIFMAGSSHLLNMRKNYSNVKSLEEVDYKIFSQNGEDGILDYILTCLKIDKPKFFLCS